MADYSDDSYVYVRVPIMYKLNDEGEIKYIDTPYHSDNENPEWNDVFHDNSMTMYNDFSKRTSSINREACILEIHLHLIVITEIMWR